ncbi:response regulator [Paenibacillus sp.]|uniref:response regulator n=1 Tax=Paenibacillus sp. TaxID=58172 RepID=UPI002D61C837|nr:response regulator [Paenibacillus sp.]HZG84020.1 response regulator [Paenibacillus sp.]
MLTLLIAEDELIERESLRYLIQQQYPSSIRIVDEAATGKEAVEKAMELKPDMILIDIQMPEMDGLTASETIRKHLPECEILILTAYGQFEYAKKAISFGARDYLLKPISNRNLFDAIDRLSDVILKRKASAERSKKMEDQFAHWRYLLEREFFLEALYTSNHAKRQLEEYLSWLEVESRLFVCMAIDLESGQAQAPSMLNAIRTRLAYHTEHVIGTALGKRIVLLLLGKLSDESVGSHSFRTALTETESMVRKNTGIACHIGLSRVFCDLNHLPYAYREAAAELDKRRTAVPLRKEEAGYPYALEEQLCDRILLEDVQGSAELVADIFHHFTAKRAEFLRQDVRQLCAQIHRSLLQHFGSFESSEVEEMTAELELLSLPQELAASLRRWLPELIAVVGEKRKSNRDELIRLIKAYLEEHVSDDLSLESVSKEIGLSTFYLSKYFKRATGVNFKEYVIQLRMERAKALILFQNKTVQEAALAVGYQDPNYFSKAFKKYTGFSPTQFTSITDK